LICLKWSTEAALIVDLSKVDHIAIAERGHTRVMASKSEMLTREEFASLLAVGNTSAVSDPPAVIPAEHSARLIGLGYMADLGGKLRMTTPGRRRGSNRPALCKPEENRGGLTSELPVPT
jgi:hypothetical protein